MAVWDNSTKPNPNEAVILSLVKMGVDVTETDNHGRTLLHCAAIDGHPGVCWELIRWGADIHARNHYGATPLRWAAFNGKKEVVKLLLESGANIWAEDDKKEATLDVDFTGLLVSQSNAWGEKLKVVMGGDCSEIKTETDLYHLASVMKPSNPKDIPPPEEFIRRLFLQYIPHNAKFAHLYEAIIAAPRPKAFDLHTARQQAAKEQGAGR